MQKKLKNNMRHIQKYKQMNRKANIDKIFINTLWREEHKKQN